ncbi:DNA cytosine methyltransferase [Phytohabitans flavus]|uniref:Cytosine-specific methyltransferase n=1 Tax=Phytohabitans flavus TaxID=1076124 RepID=A0A6F8Y5D6_9ACTN|nr:DNA cytosine methyltransferase [Phytohabitans flavus]BCB81198.1 cytosine-specific methyltransferase [Phytohabitans flavus]
MAGWDSGKTTDLSPADALRLIDLFAGCGGLTAGFHATGHYKSVAAVENDFAAACTYAANFGEENIHWGDIAEWVRGDLPAADVVVGGPPCQGFSSLGSRRMDDPRNELWRHYVDTLVQVQPKAFVLENVPQFEQSAQFNSFCKETRSRGRLRNYVLHRAVVKATDFGAPQLRRRLIVIGTRTDLAPIEVPSPRVAEKDWKTVRHAIGDLVGSVDPEQTSLPGTAETFFGRSVSGIYKATDLDFARNYTKLSQDRMKHIPEGGNRFNLPDRLKAPCWIGHARGSHDVFGRLRWERPSVTIRTEFFKPEKGRYLHPTENRALSHHEAARLQGFDDDFVWCGSKIEIACQIGNAVPVQLARALADHISESLDESA